MKHLPYITSLLLLTAAALLLGPFALGRPLSRVELLVIGLLVVGVVARWQVVVRKRERRKLEEMRDSALW